MGEAKQKILYDNFIAIATNVKKDLSGKVPQDFKPIVRENCAGYAADILKSFPQFAKKDSKNKEPEEPADEGEDKPKDKAKKSSKGA